MIQTRKEDLPTVTEIMTPPMLNLLSFLSTIRGSDYEYTKLEIAEAAEVSYPTLLRLWPTVEELKLMIPGRKLGPVQLYKVNSELELIKRFDAFEMELVKIITDKMAAEETTKEKIRETKVGKAEVQVHV